MMATSWTSVWIIMMLLHKYLLIRQSHGWRLASRVARRHFFAPSSPSKLVRKNLFHDAPTTHRHRRLFSTESGIDEEVRLDSKEGELADDDAESVEIDLSTLTPGIMEGFYVTSQLETPSLFDLSAMDHDSVTRLGLKSDNVSLPVALMMTDPENWASFSRARKSCRKGAILIHRGPLVRDEFDVSKCIIGRVGDRVFPGDVLANQARMGGGKYATVGYKQPFDLPVVYEDDYMAIVNKPAGIVVYSHKGGGYGTMTIRACLPFVITPPKNGTYSVLRRPQPVHRLDKPTSGLLLIAKTKPAMQALSFQFVNRTIQKTYTAIVNGIPFETTDGELSSHEAYNMNVDVDPDDETAKWQYIEYSLENQKVWKEAITLWRSIRYAKSLKAKDEILTMVEMKPKTGRFHQLRRHMSFVCKTPIIGDSDYDGGGDAARLRQRGLFLCSNRVTLEHPFYNTPDGRKAFESLPDCPPNVSMRDEKVMVTVSIDLPPKFESFLKKEEQRAETASNSQKKL